MKNLKYAFGFLMSFLTIAAISSCSNEDDYTPGEPAPVEVSEYYFASGTETALTIGLTQNLITAEINRVNAEGEETLELVVTNPSNEYFAVPTSVTFADGETTATIEIVVSDSLPLFQNYQFSIQIPSEYINPYVDANNNSTLHYVVMRDDYKPFAYGIYQSAWCEAEFEAVLEFSEALQTYRIKSFCMIEGYDVTFKMDEDYNITMTSSSFSSGYEHPAYGMVTAVVYKDGSYNGYDPETNLFKFAYTWTVTAGSFGTFYDYFMITELAE